MNSLNKPMAIIGLPGSGKTTVGALLAQTLGLDFTDSDQVLKTQIKVSIREYFEKYGEESFRDQESAVLKNLAFAPDKKGVVSTGGGAVIRKSNREILAQNFFVIYLQSTPLEIFERLRHDTQRPLLQVSDPMFKLKELSSLRAPLYEEIAHLTFSTQNLSVEKTVFELQGLLNKIKYNE